MLCHRRYPFAQRLDHSKAVGNPRPSMPASGNEMQSVEALRESTNWFGPLWLQSRQDTDFRGWGKRICAHFRSTCLCFLQDMVSGQWARIIFLRVQRESAYLPSSEQSN